MNGPRVRERGRGQLDAISILGFRDKDAEWEGPLRAAHEEGLRGAPRGEAHSPARKHYEEGLALFCLSSRAEIDPRAGVCHENQKCKHSEDISNHGCVFLKRQTSTRTGWRLQFKSNWQLQGCLRTGLCSLKSCHTELTTTIC